jgi:hypothetical protein
MFAPVDANCVVDLIHRPLSADARTGRINSAPPPRRRAAMLDLCSRSTFSPLPATGAVTVRCPQDASTCAGVWREGNDGLGWRWWRGGGLRPPCGTRFGARSESSACGQIEPPANVRLWTLPLPSGPSQIHPPLRQLALASRFACPSCGQKIWQKFK